MDWPAVLGIYGAIVATVVAGWTIRTGLRDRGHLQLRIGLKRYDQDRSTGEVVEMALDSAAGLRLHLSVTKRLSRNTVCPNSGKTGFPVTVRYVKSIRHASCRIEQRLHLVHHCPQLLRSAK
jgi:hypothetical protein